MSVGMEKLTAEANRITDSPYPTQLKHLRDVLCTECTETDITQWTLSKPCQIDRLSSCILDGLTQWPHVLEIVSRLSRNSTFRDAFMRLEPHLLSDLVTQAVEGHDIHSDHTTAVTNMLSHPLPSHTALPSRLQDLFVRLVNSAAQAPSDTVIKPIYQILRGTSSLFVGILSSTTLRRFEHQLCAILKSLKGDNQTLSLYCLAVMKTMSHTSSHSLASSAASSYATQELLDTSSLSASDEKWTPEIVQQFFSENKAQKTMQLLVLRVMWACTNSTGESVEQKLETLMLANELISAVSVESREVWRKNNSLIARKLEEKVLIDGTDLQCRLQALCFLSKLTEGFMVSNSALDNLRDIVTVPDKLIQALADTTAFDIGQLVTAGVFDQVTTTALLQNLVDSATSTTNQSWMHGSVVIAQLLQQLCSVVAVDNKIGEGAMVALDVLACGHKMGRLSDIIKPIHEEYPSGLFGGMCFNALRETRKQVVHQLCVLILKASLSASHRTFAVSPATISLLLKLHGDSAGPPQACTHIREINASERISTSSSAEKVRSGTRSNWREALAQHLRSRAEDEQRALIIMFGKACAELETRCEDVERPLREEEKQRAAMEAQHDEIQMAYETLEAQTIERQIRFDASTTENERLARDLATLHRELDAAAKQLEESERRLVRSHAEQERASVEAEEVKCRLELKHLAALARKEEELEEANERSSEVSAKLQGSTRELEQQNSELSALKDEAAMLRLACDALQRQCDENNSALEETTRSKTDAVRQQKQLETDLRASRNTLEAAEEARVKDRELYTQREREKAVEHGKCLQDVVVKHGELVSRLEHQLGSLRSEMDQLQQMHAEEISRRDSEVTEKRKRACSFHFACSLLLRFANLSPQIDRLERKCEEKDRQIAEADAMRNNLMAAIGLGGRQSARSGKFAHRSSNSYTHDQSQDDLSPATPRSGDDEATTQQVRRTDELDVPSATSSIDSRSGPTPKRARQKRQIVVSAPAKPLSTTKAVLPPSPAVRTGAQMRSVVKCRQPLQTVSVNRPSPHKRGLTSVTSKSVMANTQMIMNNKTIEESGLFAGTPRLGVTGLEGDMDEDTQSGLSE